MTNPRTIAFLGTGNMASALLRGAVGRGGWSPDTLGAYDVRPEAGAALARELGVRTFASHGEACAWAQVIVLAVKPQVLPQVLADIAAGVRADQLVISIVAGVPIARIASQLGGDRRVIRTMPNAPALVGAGATAIAYGPGLTPSDVTLAQSLFSSVGRTVEVEERLMDAVTGLSGSGPAYALIAIEALSDAGVRAGLARPTALALAAQTLLGAAQMVLETGQHPAQLRDTVTSPGGTTIAGICALERHGLRHALLEAVDAAVARAKALGG